MAYVRVGEENDLTMYNEIQAKFRNVETLKTVYRKQCGEGASIAHRIPHLAFKDYMMEVYDRVVPVLLEDPRITIMTAPCDLMHDTINNVVIPVVAKVSMLRYAWNDGPDRENVNNIVQHMIEFYQNMFNVEFRGGEDNTPHAIAIYDLLIPCAMSVDPHTNRKRFPFLTRFAMERFVKNDIQSFNYDEGEE